MTARYILAIDQGTTGSTVLVVDVTQPHSPQVIGQSTVGFVQHFPQTGWVEHDLEEVWGSIAKASIEALAHARGAHPQFSAQKIAAIGITNQRETLCTFERKTGRPLARAIVWQCKRSLDICRRLKKDGAEAQFKARTGLVLDPYFSGTKMSWLMENRPDIARRVESGEAVFGTIDSYLISRLTAGRSFVTESSNASRTLVYDIHKGAWDRELSDALKLPSTACLPEVRDSAGLFGKTKGVGFLPDGIPITGVLGDQQAALAGQTCYSVGEAKCTYGTGAFLLLNLGEKALVSSHGMLTTVAWSLGGRLTYAFEGASFIAGAAVQFLRDQLQMVVSAADSESMAAGVVGAPEIYFVPALAGLGAPYWDPKAQGAIFGMTRGTAKAQVVRAALEGIVFQVCDLLSAMRQDFDRDITVLRADGGAAANGILMQSQADFAGISVDRPVNLETTAMGAAMFAGLGAGIYSGLDELRGARRSDRTFEPVCDTIARELIAEKMAGWSRAVRAVQVFAGSAD